LRRQTCGTQDALVLASVRILAIRLMGHRQQRLLEAQESLMNRRNENSEGFSMLELVIVMAIILCIAAIAFPKIQGAIEGVKLRSTITDIDGLVQQLRIQGVRANRSYTIRTAPATAGNG